MADLRKSAHCQKMKTLSEFQMSNRGWTKKPRYGNEFNSKKYTYVSRQGKGHVVKPPQKRELYAQGRKSTGTHYHTNTRKNNFCRTLMLAWDGCSETTGYP